MNLFISSILLYVYLARYKSVILSCYLSIYQIQNFQKVKASPSPSNFEFQAHFCSRSPNPPDIDPKKSSTSIEQLTILLSAKKNGGFIKLYGELI